MMQFISLYTQNESIANTKIINAIVVLIGTKLKNCGNNSPQHINPVNIVKNNVPLNKVNGVQTLYKYNNPVIVVIYTLIVL